MKILLSFLCLSFLVAGCGLKGGDDERQEILDALLKKHDDDLTYCHDQFSKKNPNHPRGKIVVYAEVAPNGEIYSVKPLSIFSGGDSIYKCLAPRIMKWDYGRTGGRDVNLTITFTFHNQKSAQ